MRNTAPHQKCAKIIPPNTGPMTAPAEKLATHFGYEITEIQILYPERFMGEAR